MKTFQAKGLCRAALNVGFFKESALAFFIVGGIVTLTGGICAQSTARATIEKRIESVHSAIEKYASALRDEDRLNDDVLALASLKAEKARILLESYQPNQILLEELQAAEALADLVGKVKGPLPLRPGLHELAYIAENDFSAQPFVVYLPKGWKPERPHPLFIFLHGYVSYLDKVNWIELMYSPELEALMERLGFILLMPFGRSNTEFMGIGEADVLRTIAWVQKRCAIDSNRIFLSGASMGGSGAYTIAAHFPDLFAGVMAIAGRYDYYLWKNIDPQKLSGFKRIQTDADYIRALLPNLRNVHTFIFHGAEDVLVQKEQSRGLFSALSDLGFRATYKEFEDGNHWIWDRCFTYEPFSKWLSETRRDPNPRIVEYRTYSLEFNRAYWVTINDVERWGQEAWILAEAKPENQIRVDTVNVASLTLILNDKLADPAKPLTVLWNGKAHGPFKDRLVTLTQEPKTINGRLRKTNILCGPVREILEKPFLFVYGTVGDEAAQQSNQARASEAGKQWSQFSAGRAHIKADTQVADAELASRSLFLFGTPADNCLIAKFSKDIPIKWEDGDYLVGSRSFPAKGNGLLVIYPSPFAANQYVVVNSGPLWGEHLSINHKWDFVPDFIIYTQDRDWDDTNKYLCAGYFDKHWRLDESLIWLGAQEKNAQIVPLR